MKDENVQIRCGALDDMMVREDASTVSPEGTLRAHCVITNVGVFSYRNPDGSIRRELRPPEEVFNEDSMASLNGVPITNMHHGLVTDENQDIVVGRLDCDVTADAYHLSATINVEDAASVKEIMEGAKRQLSAGYQCTIDHTSGTWMGVRYDCIQRNIRYNHVALVPTARAGDDATIRLDGADTAVGFERGEETNIKEQTMNTKKIRLDEAEVEVDANVAAHILRQDEAMKAKDAEIAKLREDMASVTAAKDKAEAERDSAVSRMDEMDKSMPGAIASAVKERLALVGKATEAGIEVKEDMSDADVRNAVIAKAYPNETFEGKSAEYMAARFDCALDKVASVKAAETNTRQDSADVPAAGEQGVKKYSAEEAKLRQDEAIRNACK